MDHPKEVIVQEWLNKLGHKPNLKEIAAQFAPDLESCVMACTLSDIDMGMDLKDYCRGIPLEDRIERYSPYPLWFKTFIRQDIESAVKIYEINGDSDGYAKLIVEDLKEFDEYVNIVKNSNVFLNNQFEATFKEVILSNEKDFKKNISDEFMDRIISGEKLEFKEDRDKKLFYFLDLNNHADFSFADLDKFNDYADEYAESFINRDVFALGKITDKYVYFYSTKDIFFYFDVEPKIDIDKKSLSRSIRKELGDEGLDFLEDSAEEMLKEMVPELVGGRGYTIAKMAAKLAYKGYESAKENIKITFSEEEAKEFYERFLKENSQGRSIRDFFLEEVKMPLTKLFIKKRLDISLIDDSFFEKQYRHFMDTRYYAQMGLLSEDAKKKIESIKDQEKKDTTVFLSVSKRKLMEDLTDSQLS